MLPISVTLRTTLVVLTPGEADRAWPLGKLEFGRVEAGDDPKRARVSQAGPIAERDQGAPVTDDRLSVLANRLPVASRRYPGA